MTRLIKQILYQKEFVMPIKRLKKISNYTMVQNTICNDTNLSWKAKGIMLVLLSKPDDWIIKIDNITKHATDGEKATRSGFKELMQAGYLTREQIRAKDGTLREVIYTAHEEPQKIDILTPPFSSNGQAAQAISAPYPQNTGAKVTVPLTQSPLADDRQASNGSLPITKQTKTQETNTAARQETKATTDHNIAAAVFGFKHCVIDDTLTKRQLVMIRKRLNLSPELWQHFSLNDIMQVIQQELESPVTFTKAGLDFYKKLNTLFKAWRKRTWSPSTAATTLVEYQTIQQQRQQEIKKLQINLRSQRQERVALEKCLLQTSDPNAKSSYENELTQVEKNIQTIIRKLHMIIPNSNSNLTEAPSC
jgi:hypothetical protein